MPAVARPRSSDERQHTSWDRARLSVVVPIGVIVAVAIVCIVVAVLSSAQRADEVAVQQLNRRQTVNTLYFADARTGRARAVLAEHDSAWLDITDDLSDWGFGPSLHLSLIHI